MYSSYDCLCQLPQIIANVDCKHYNRKHLCLRRNVTIHLDSILNALLLL